MKTFNLTDDQVEKIVEALNNKINDIRLGHSKSYDRLMHKITKNLEQRKKDQEIVDRAEEKISGLEKIIKEIKNNAWLL